MNTRESLDSRILRWSGFAMAAFLAAAFTLAALTDQPAAYAAREAQTTEVLR